MTDLPDLVALAQFDDRLREVPVDRSAVEDAARAAAEALSAARDGPEKARLLGYLGNAARILGRTDEAVAYLTAALDGAEDVRARVVAMTRLGEAYRSADRFGEAESLLRTAHELAGAEAVDLTDFALQHLGKCLLDQGRDAEAVASLEQALVLRERKGDPDLIASTHLALELARSRGRVA